jgi:GNAT superfamily N-acetyltransferase
MTSLLGEYLELRPLLEADIPDLHKIYQGTPLYFDGLGDTASRLTLAEVRSQWQANQVPGRYLLGAYHIVTGLLIGVAEVRINQPQLAMATVWILVWGGFQRQGYGQDMMALIESWLIPDQGVETLCTIASQNEEGLSFLQLQGFQVTDQITDPPIGRGQAFYAYW